jgi:hypothetical protein
MSFSALLIGSFPWIITLCVVAFFVVAMILVSILEEMAADSYSYRLTGHIGIVEFLAKYHSKTLYSRLRMWRLLKYVRA